MSQQSPAGWFRDPLGRYEHRYWDGARWTEHVGSAGQQTIDAPVVVAPPTAVPQQTTIMPAAAAATVSPVNRKVQKQLRKLGINESASAGGGTLFTERVLVI